MKKFTKIDEDLIKENVELSKKFSNAYASSLRKLDIIKIALDNLAVEQSKDSRNWGLLGSLNKVNSDLVDILEFLDVKDILDDSDKYNI